MLARANPQFCLGKVYLLSALYVTVFALFGTENSLIELAIAKELSGRNMLEHGKIDIAITYLKASIELFSKLGAPGKAAVLEREVEGLSS